MAAEEPPERWPEDVHRWREVAAAEYLDESRRTDPVNQPTNGKDLP
jgi:hypothetical protein